MMQMATLFGSSLLPGYAAITFSFVFFSAKYFKGQIVVFRFFSLFPDISSLPSLFVNMALLVITSSGMYQPINTSKPPQKSPSVFLTLFVDIWLGTWWYFFTASVIVFTCLALAFCTPSMSCTVFFFSLDSLEIYFSSQPSSVSFPWYISEVSCFPLNSFLSAFWSLLLFLFQSQNTTSWSPVKNAKRLVIC